MNDPTKNDIAPLSRPPRDLLEQWQWLHRNDWKALLRPKWFEDEDTQSTSTGDDHG